MALVSTTADALLTTSQRNHLGPSLPPPSRDVSARPHAPASLGGAGGGPSPEQSGAVGATAVAPRPDPQQEIATLQVVGAGDRRDGIKCGIS